MITYMVGFPFARALVEENVRGCVSISGDAATVNSCGNRLGLDMLLNSHHVTFRGSVLIRNIRCAGGFDTLSIFGNGQCIRMLLKTWSGREDLNLRPPAPKAGVPPT
jgi:hypothetical protein